MISDIISYRKEERPYFGIYPLPGKAGCVIP